MTTTAISAFNKERRKQSIIISKSKNRSQKEIHANNKTKRREKIKKKQRASKFLINSSQLWQ